MKSDILIKQEGFQALKEKLGPVDMEKFIALLSREKFDYTKWRKNLFEDMSLDEMAEAANSFSRGLQNHPES